MYISTPDLSDLLGLDYSVMYSWPDNLKPARVSRNGHMHRFADVNAWLAESGRAYGFEKPPTIEQLVAGEVVLVRRKHVEQMLQGVLPGNMEKYLKRHMRDGYFQTLELRRDLWVVTVRSVEQHIRDYLVRQDDLDKGLVAHVLGVSSTTVYRLIERGSLHARRRFDLPHVRQITRESLVAYLRILLARAGGAVSAEDWLEDRLQSSEPLLKVSEAADRLVVSVDQVRELVASGKLHSIVPWENGPRLISPDSVASCQENSPYLTFEEMSRILGLTRRSASECFYNGDLKCPLHTGEPRCRMWRWCMAAFLAGKLSAGESPEDWVRAATRGVRRRIAVSERTVLKKKLLTRPQLDAAVEAGRIPVLTLNSQHRAYPQYAIKKESKRYR